MKYICTTTFIAIILLLCMHVSFAQEELKPNFKVRILINTDDEDTKQTTESYLSRELRSLGDVTIVDTGEDCTLEVIVIEGKTLSGVKNNIALSVAYYEPQDVMDLLLVRSGLSSLLITLASHPVTEQRQELIENVTALTDIMVKACYTVGYRSLKEHLLYTGAIDDLRKGCEKTIVDFDNLYLKEKRKAIAKIKASVFREGESTKP